MAFFDSSKLVRIVLPNGLQTIGRSAFDDTSLEEVDIPSSVTYMNGCFGGCRNLKRVSLPEGVDLSNADNLFCLCTALESVELPHSMKELPFRMFYASAIKNVIIPEGVAKISESTFEYCKNLESIIIPEGVTKIPKSAFKHCEKLESVVIPESVRVISESAFEYCDNLESIIIPPKVTEIWEKAFANCKSLKRVVFKNKKFNWLFGNIFEGSDNVTIVAPHGHIMIDYAKKHNIKFEEI